MILCTQQGTEHRAEYLKGQYVNFLRVLRGANAGLKYPPHVLKDGDERQILRRHGVQVQNLLETISGKILSRLNKNMVTLNFIVTFRVAATVQ